MAIEVAIVLSLSGRTGIAQNLPARCRIFSRQEVGHTVLLTASRFPVPAEPAHDDDTAAKNQSANEQMLGAIGQREQERKVRREEIERERQGRAGALGQMQDAEDAARHQAGQDAIAAAAADLETAKQEWKAAVAALGDEDKANAETPTSPVSSAIENLKKSLMQSGQAVTAEKQAIENKSAFNAFAISGLGADSLSDRQLRAMEQTAANTRKLIKVVEDAGLNYG